MAIDMDWLNAQVDGYITVRQAYIKFARSLKLILENALVSLGISAIVEARAKEISSFAEKCIRKKDFFPNPLHQFTDLCGARVIVTSKDQIEPICNYIRKHFEIDEGNSEDLIERLRAGEFGYLSLHFIVSFKQNTEYFGVNIDEDLYLRRADRDTREAGLAMGPKFKAEIQVRTLLQHAWADIIHDNLYKTDFKVPRHLEREGGRIAALLEDADDSFVRLLEGVASYRSYYGAYMSRKSIREEIEIFETVLRRDPDNEKVATQIAKMAITLEDWRKVATILKKFKNHRKPEILRDYGIALWNLGDPAGQKYLTEAVELNPNDADAQCALGDTLFAKNKAETLGIYQRAFQAAPDYPRALRSYVQCKILCEKNLDFLSLIQPSLKAAINVLHKWAHVGVNLPWAYYDMGFFNLLLGRTYESLAAFAKAVQLSVTEAPIEQTCRLLEELQQELKDRGKIIAEPLECARKFLRVALVGKLMTLAKSDANKQTKAMEAPFKCLSDIKTDPKVSRDLLSKARTEKKAIFDKKQNVLIVAGGCDASVAQKIDEYRYLIERALKDFQGIIISGGTTAGISGIVGDLENPGQEIKKVAYLPKQLPRGDIEHPAYTVYHTPGDDYGPLQPIQGWIDLIVCGIKPDRVKLIGINGGNLAAFEYRLGLALGAKVGILRDSGREATRISDDPGWESDPGLLLLPTDEETVKLFLNPSSVSKVIKNKDREEFARLEHEQYRKSRSHVFLRLEPAMADWDELNNDLKQSNLEMVDHIEAKLDRIGLKLRQVPKKNVKLYSFSKDQVEILAEMEHSRWNVERLLQGWRLGRRDPVNKTSPYIVSWKELPENVKVWDRDTVSRLPLLLKRRGYEIYQPE